VIQGAAHTQKHVLVHIPIIIIIKLNIIYWRKRRRVLWCSIVLWNWHKFVPFLVPIVPQHFVFEEEKMSFYNNNCILFIYIYKVM
jgi:hypothetical protein